MSTLATDRPDRLVHKAERALTVATVLGVVEIIRRTPRWLLIITGLLVYTAVMLVFVYAIWVGIALGAVVAWKVGRGVLQGWRHARHQTLR